MVQKEENDFIREHFDPYKTKNRNCLVHDSNTTAAHRKIVSELFEWAIQNKLTVYTRACLKGGEIVDIAILGLSRPFIEVRGSELKKQKEYLPQYNHLRQFVDCGDPYKLT